MVPLIAAAVIIAADQVVKLLVAANCSLYETKTLIKGILEFCYLHNDGAAMGILSGGRWYLIVLTALLIVALVVYMLIGKEKPPFLMWSLALIIGGGMGNLIDRIRLGYVTDFVRFPIRWFSYSFNIADCAVVVGGCMLALYLVIDIIKAGRKNDNSKS